MTRALRTLRNGRHASMRISWTVVDQGLSALTNLLLSVLVARSVSANAFGAFAVAFLVYGLVLGLSRAVIGQPLQISSASATDSEFRGAAGHALGAALIFGAASAVLAAVVGLIVGAQTGGALTALGLWFPALIVQDVCRMAFFTEGRPKRAAAIDSVWAVIVLGGFSATSAFGIAGDVVVPLMLWGFGAAVAAVHGMVLLGVGARLRGAAWWMRSRRHISRYLGLEYLLSMGIAQTGILMVGFAATQAGVGAIRAVQMLLGPTNVVGTAAMIFTTTEVAARPSASARSRSRFASGVSAVLATVIAVYVGVLLVLPDSVGRHLLGETWDGAKTVMVPLCVAAVAAALSAGPAASLYGMGLVRATFFINVVRAALNILLLAIGIWIWGAVGAAWALAITEIALLPLWFIRLRTAVRSVRNDSAAATPTEAHTEDHQPYAVCVEPRIG